MSTGLRVGYGICPLNLMEYLWRMKQQYNVSVVAELAACAALSNSTYLEVFFLHKKLFFLTWNCLQEVKNALVKEREDMFRMMSSFDNLDPYESQSNFILCRYFFLQI